MKPYFVWSAYDGCNYYRCLLPTIHNGWQGDRTELSLIDIDRTRAYELAMQSDPIVFHRPDQPEKLEAALRLKDLGKTIFYDNDDTFKVDDAMKMGEYLQDRARNLDEFIKISDLVTTSTEFLANEYRKLNKNVVVLPNYIDPLDWPEPQKNLTGKIRIGFVGSVLSNGDYDSVWPALERLNQNKHIQIVVFGLPPDNIKSKMVREMFKDEVAQWKRLDIDWRTWVHMSNYFDALAERTIDVMVIPRKDNYFNRCKSNVKFLEASMLKIPVVAQGFSDGLSPYQTNPKDAQHMKIVTDDSRWYDEIMNLVESPQARTEMGERAYHYVLNNYNIETKAYQWRDAYSKVWK